MLKGKSCVFPMIYWIASGKTSETLISQGKILVQHKDGFKDYKFAGC